MIFLTLAKHKPLLIPNIHGFLAFINQTYPITEEILG